MGALRALFAEVVGMFVDDGSLALMAVALVAAVTAAIKLAAVPPLGGAIVLVIGTVLVLAASLFRATRRR